MRQYRVKGEEKSYLEVLGENGNELQVEIIRERNGEFQRRRETITRTLFETCLNTNYLMLLDIPLKDKANSLEPALSA